MYPSPDLKKSQGFQRWRPSSAQEAGVGINKDQQMLNSGVPEPLVPMFLNLGLSRLQSESLLANFRLGKDKLS